MFTSLHNSSLPLLWGSSARAHDATTSGSSPLWSRLTRAAGKPVAAFGKLLGDFEVGPDQDASAQRALETRKAVLNLQLRSAVSLEQWRFAAAELDGIEGNNIWKQEHESPEYNYNLVQARLERLDDARISCDASRMLSEIRTALSRHLGGVSNVRLYKHSHIGTKTLIERYISSALGTLSALLELTKSRYESELDSRLVLDQVLLARQSFGRSALLLSGGGTFGMSHIGVIKCLWEQHLLPRIISGASAGSICCAVLCARTDDEIPRTLDEFCYGDLNVFTGTDGKDSILSQLTRFLKTGAIFDIANLTRVMKDLIGDMTFQEAYNRTRRILNITVSSASVFELPRLLNYVTSPNVLIWSAVAASCSVPMVFTSATLLAKDPRTGFISPWNPSPQRWIDGSVDNDLPMTRLAEMFNVNHFIVSQVNPHVIPFLAHEQYEIEKEAQANESSSAHGPSWLNVVANLAKDEAMHRMQIMSEVGILPNLLSKAMSILSQKYSGDITILPEVSFAQFPRVLSNPDTAFMLQSTLLGERATWPKLSQIQNHCAIELALDDAVQHLRARIAFSPSQVDLRLNTIVRPGSRAGSEGRSSRHGRTQHKRLKFNGEDDESAFKANSSRPLSFHERHSNSRAPIMSSNSPRRRQQPGTPLHLDIKTTRSPMFSTGSEADSDSSHSPSLFDSDPSSPTEEEHSSSADRRYLFPHASQPSTPHPQNRRMSYFAPNALKSPTPPIAPSTNLELRMTPAIHRSSTNLQEADGRRKKFAGSTPRTTSPLRSTDLAKGFESTPFDNRTGTSPRSSLEIPRSSLEKTMSDADMDVSGTKGMLRRKKTTGLSGASKMSGKK